jgi:3-oxoacyl-[acyl-carrier protein] reductase
MSVMAGKVALVTGAGRGVGQATAIRLAREGVRLIVNDLDAAELETTLNTIASIGADATGFVGDVCDPATADDLVQVCLSTYNQIDIIVNNAGYIWNGAMHNHTDEQWQAMLEIHATAPFRILRAFSEWLRPVAKAEIASYGRAVARKVVNVSSVSGTTGSATQVAYATGKAAVVGLTKTLAKEWGRYNVTVNAVAFGHIETRLTQSYEQDPPAIDVMGRKHKVGLAAAQIKAMDKSVPLGRPGTVEEAAGAIYLLCTPDADYITGQVLTCSGGA